MRSGCSTPTRPIFVNSLSTLRVIRHFRSGRPTARSIIFRSNYVNSILDVNKTWSEQNLRLLPALGGDELFHAWDWSPDGKSLIGTLDGPTSVVGYYSFETNQYEQLTEFGNGPMWLADSTRFVFYVE